MPETKIIFFDIDWTLYDHCSHKWVLSSLSAIKELQKKGIKVWLCSARPYDSMKLFGVFDLGIKWDGYIASAGAVAVAKHHVVKALTIKPQLIKKLINICQDNHLTLQLLGLKSAYMVFPANDEVRNYLKDYHDPLSKVRPYDGKPVTSILLFAKKDMDPIIKKECPGFTYYFRFHESAVDVADSVHEKGDAIKDVLDYYGFSKNQAMAFGDDPQDLSMKEEVNTFVCVGNGKDETKEKADYVCESITEDGISKALTKFGLL